MEQSTKNEKTCQQYVKSYDKFKSYIIKTDFLINCTTFEKY